MHVVASLLSCPPARFIGSELATTDLLQALIARGHSTAVIVGERRYRSRWEYAGIPVVHRQQWRKAGRPDVVLCHVDAHSNGSLLARRWGAPLVGICHNGEPAVATGLRQARLDLTCVTADWLRRPLRVPDALVVRPWTDVHVPPTHGDAVTMVNLNENKGGDLLWRVAEAMPDVDFLAVRGGYGSQWQGPDLPNLRVQRHVPADQMDEAVWAHTRILLMPSQRETWGRTAVEACARGIPVIAHPAPGLCESLGDAGVFADRDDLGAWVAAVRHLLDGRRWRTASRKASARARSLGLEHDVAAFCDAIENLGRTRGDVPVAG